MHKNISDIKSSKDEVYFTQLPFSRDDDAFMTSFSLFTLYTPLLLYFTSQMFSSVDGSNVVTAETGKKDVHLIVEPIIFWLRYEFLNTVKHTICFVHFQATVCPFVVVT